MLKQLLSLNRYPYYVRRLAWKFLVPRSLRLKGVTVSKTAHFKGNPIVSMERNSTISIGDRCSLCSVSDQTALGVNHPIVLRTLRSGAVIEIAADTGISGGTICSAISVKVGAGCLFGANVTIVDTDFHPILAENRRYNNNPEDIKCAPVVIEDNVFLGTGVTVMKGVKVGRNSVVAAGAVVSKSVPPNSIAAGNPAKVVKSLSA